MRLCENIARLHPLPSGMRRTQEAAAPGDGSHRVRRPGDQVWQRKMKLCRVISESDLQ